MLNLGVIGLGYMGRTHLGAAEKLDGVQVVAVADARDPGAVRFRGKAIPVYDDASGLLRHEGLDAVAICVPTYLHEECVTAAAAAGKGHPLWKAVRALPGFGGADAAGRASFRRPAHDRASAAVLAPLCAFAPNGAKWRNRRSENRFRLAPGGVSGLGNVVQRTPR